MRAPAHPPARLTQLSIMRGRTYDLLTVNAQERDILPLLGCGAPTYAVRASHDKVQAVIALLHAYYGGVKVLRVAPIDEHEDEIFFQVQGS